MLITKGVLTMILFPMNVTQTMRLTNRSKDSDRT